MNFFGKYRDRLGSRKTNGASAVEDQAAFNRLRQQYVHFCAGPLTTHEAASREFEELCAHEQVAKIAIVFKADSSNLIIQTKGIILRDDKSGCYHDIGEMMIVMRRKPEVHIDFFNLTRMVTQKTERGDWHYHHPHVNSAGTLCSSNSGSIMQELAVGKVFSATRLTLDALNTYGPNSPYCGIHFWPEIKLQPENKDVGYQET